MRRLDASGTPQPGTTEAQHGSALGGQERGRRESESQVGDGERRGETRLFPPSDLQGSNPFLHLVPRHNRKSPAATQPQRGGVQGGSIQLSRASTMRNPIYLFIKVGWVFTLISPGTQFCNLVIQTRCQTTETFPLHHYELGRAAAWRLRNVRDPPDTNIFTWVTYLFSCICRHEQRLIIPILLLHPMW